MTRSGRAPSKTNFQPLGISRLDIVGNGLDDAGCARGFDRHDTNVVLEKGPAAISGQFLHQRGAHMFAAQGHVLGEEQAEPLIAKELAGRIRRFHHAVRIAEQKIAGVERTFVTSVTKFWNQAGRRFRIGGRQAENRTRGAATNQRSRVTGAAVSQSVARGVDHAEKRRGKNRLSRTFEHRRKAAVDFSQDMRGIFGAFAEFAHDAADQSGEQSGPNAMSHHIADEHAAFGVGKLGDVEEISTERGRRNVAIRETQRTGFGRECREETREISRGRKVSWT